ncbi:MAG: PAS domain-containing protein [Planctomycetota bacterium]|jgi:PAS domain S-box-containing protein
MSSAAVTNSAELLSTSASRIASNAVDAAGTGEALETSLVQFVRQLAASLESRSPLDIAGLSKIATDDLQMARLLRAVEAECIVFLGEQAGVPVGPDVLSLRAAIRAAIPPTPLSHEEAAFYRQLMEGPGDGAPTGVARLTHLFQTLTATMPDMVYVHDTDGNLLYINRTGLAIVGYTREDLLAGLSIYDLIVPSYLDLVEERMARAPVAVKPYSIEILTKDGRHCPIEIATRPLIHNKSLIGVVGVARNTRLERRLESSLLRSNLYLENLVRSVSVGVLITDADGRISEANDAALQLLGAPSARELLGLSLHELPEEPRPGLEDIVAQTIESGEERVVQCGHRTRFGAAFTCEAQLLPVREGNNKALCMIVLLQDATH